MPIRVLSVASEIYPLVKTGGLADVVGALPAALAAEDVHVVTLVPGYPAVMAALETKRLVVEIDTLFGGPARLLGGRAADHDLLVIDAPHLFDRPGNPYLDTAGRDWPDNAQRFAALAWVGAQIGVGLIPKYMPALIHVHDWQAALVPAYLHYIRKPAPPTVMTIHNLAFQGIFPASLLADLKLPADAMRVDGVEYYGAIGFLKAGILFADRVTTVSPSYATEIMTGAGGMGLGGLLAGRATSLVGILNGIDETVWNPAKDPLLPTRYDLDRTELRGNNKAVLQHRFGLTADASAPVFGVVSRLSEQKGLDLLLSTLPNLCARGGQLALIGTGDAGLESGFREAVMRYPGQVACIFEYDERIAHLVQGGADMLLVPSRFEPCGLTQLCALRYGNVPVVARIGGLADTIIDANVAALQADVATGFTFSPVAQPELSEAIARAIAAFVDPLQWRHIQRNGMATDVSWRRSARKYAELFRNVLTARQPIKE